MAQMQIVIVKMGVELKVVNTSGFNLIFPTKSCTPTKKAKEGHDPQFVMDPHF